MWIGRCSNEKEEFRSQESEVRMARVTAGGGDSDFGGGIRARCAAKDRRADKTGG
jgi:hypothetical protein